MNIVVLIALLVIVAVFLAMVAFHRWLRSTNDIQQRLVGANFRANRSSTMSQREVLAERMNRRLGRFAFFARLERQLAAADSPMSVAEHLMLRFGCTSGGFLLGWLASGVILSGIMVAIIGWMVPTIVLSRQQARRMRAFNNQLPDMLNLMVGSLRAGHGLLHACNVIKQEMPDPLSTEIGRVIRETSLGYSIDRAWNHLVERMQSEDLKLIVTCINIQNEVGGSLSEVLENIGETIRERVKLKGELVVLTAQQRATGWVLSVLPFGVGTLLMVLNPNYMMGMFEPGWPRLIPLAAGVMIILGNLTIQYILKIDI
jgi:tight adherence protein B